MSKITESAKGENCQVRIPGVCNFNPETTIFAHLDGNGVGQKNSDFLGSYCCSECHRVLHTGHKLYPDKKLLTIYHYEGIFRTQQILYKKGLILLKGDTGNGRKKRKW